MPKIMPQSFGAVTVVRPAALLGMALLLGAATLSFAGAKPPTPTAPTPCILQCVKQMNENNNGCGILPRSVPIRQRCFDDAKAVFKACKSSC
jgi:hypothetical protein